MTALPPPMANPVPPCDVETLRAELFKARGAQQTAEIARQTAATAQQTAEIALANEREANVAEAVRTTINDAIRGQYEANSERDRAWFHLEQSQRILCALKEQLVDTLLENQFLRRKNKELTAVPSCSQYSQYAHYSTRYRSSNPPIVRHQTLTPTPGASRGPTRPPTPLSRPFGSPMGPLERGLPGLPSHDRPIIPSWSPSPSPPW